jgi:hypothetical protein
MKMEKSLARKNRLEVKKEAGSGVEINDWWFKIDCPLLLFAFLRFATAEMILFCWRNISSTG